MLEFYRKHYVSKSVFVNLLDVVVAAILTISMIGHLTTILSGVWIFILLLLWCKAGLTIFCMIRYRHEKEED